MRGRLTAALAVAALTFTVFLPALELGFTGYDDDGYVTANPRVAAGLGAGGIAWAFREAHLANWHPLTWISHMADASLFGLDPRGHHLTSVLLHAVNAALLVLVLGGMTGTVWPAALAGALFGVHPLRVESVAWVAERKDVLSALFWFLAMAAYLRYARRPGLLRHGLVLLAAAAALMAKAMAVTLPCVLLLLDVWPLGRLRHVGGSGPGGDSAARLVLEKVPLFVLSALSAVVTYLAQSSGGTVLTFDQVRVGVRFANACLSSLRYLGAAFWPSGLAVHYPLSDVPPPLWQVAGGAFTLAGLTLAALVQARRRPWLPVGWLWYLGTLVPVLGLVQVGSQAMADRYTYLPLVGIAAALAVGLGRMLPAGRWRHSLSIAAATALVVLAAATRSQTGYWRSGEDLFRHAVAVNAGNWVAHDTLGVYLARAGRLGEAEAHHRAAVRLAPRYLFAHYHLGLCLERQGRIPEAMESYRSALAIRPRHAESHNNLGYLLLKQGRPEEAIPHLEAAVRWGPALAFAHANLGNALMRVGRREEARARIAESLRLGSR